MKGRRAKRGGEETRSREGVGGRSEGGEEAGRRERNR